jgi:hypothetical protein
MKNFLRMLFNRLPLPPTCESEDAKVVPDKVVEVDVEGALAFLQHQRNHILNLVGHPPVPVSYDLKLLIRLTMMICKIAKGIQPVIVKRID